jgi:hypothetical protein
VESRRSAFSLSKRTQCNAEIVLRPRPIERNPFARPLLQRRTISRYRLIEPCRSSLSLAERAERDAQIVTSGAALVARRRKHQLLAPQGDRADEMHIASPIAAVFIKRLRLGTQELRDLRRVRDMNRTRKLQDRRRRFAVVGRQRDVPLASIERCHARLIAFAPFRLFAPHLFRGPAQSRACDARLSSIDLFLRPRKRTADDLVQVGLDRPSRDLLFINFDGVGHCLLHAIEIEPFVAGDAFRHFFDEPIGDVALLRGFPRIIDGPERAARRAGVAPFWRRFAPKRPATIPFYFSKSVLS